MKDKFYTGFPRDSDGHSLRLKLGENYIALEIMEGIMVFNDLSDKDADTFASEEGAESWVRVRALSVQDAFDNFFAAHDQWVSGWSTFSDKNLEE